jgi:hypothetical protein
MNFPKQIDSRRQILLCSLTCLALTVFMFGPSLWLMRGYHPGTFQWDRAHAYLLQCENPFRRDIEPAMFWRLLLPVVCHAAGLTGQAALLVPFAGVLALSVYVVVLLRRRLADARFVFGGSLMFTTTSGVLVPLHWFGVNDAWAWLGQLAVAFGAAPWAIPLACLLAPWVDERFIIGLPLALVVRFAERGERLAWRRLAAPGLWLIPYAAIRLAFSFNPVVAKATESFLVHHITWQTAVILPWAPLGWWMGLRAAWVPAIFAVNRQRWILGGTAAATAVISLMLAADISRSIAILAPLSLLGLILFARQRPDLAPRAALCVGVANLFIPAAHVVYTKFDLINPLPVEILRLLRGS